MTLQSYFLFWNPFKPHFLFLRSYFLPLLPLASISYHLYHIPCTLYLPCLLCCTFPSNYPFPYALLSFLSLSLPIFCTPFPFLCILLLLLQFPSSCSPIPGPCTFLPINCMCYFSLSPIALPSPSFTILHPASVSLSLAYITQFILHTHSPTGTNPSSSN